MPHDRREVWWGPALHKSGPAYRPWVIVSDATHPFSDTECIALAMTTKRHAGSVEVPDEGWVDGGSDLESYISPWYVTTIKLRDFDRQQGTLAEQLVDEAVQTLHRFIPIDQG